MFFSQKYPYIVRAEELSEDPPEGTPFTVALPGTEKPGRSRVYRAWNAQKELISTLEPEVFKYLMWLYTRSKIAPILTQTHSITDPHHP